MRLEILIGIGIGILLFLFYLGINITPFLLLGFLGILLYFTSVKKGLLKAGSFQEISSNSLQFDNIGGQEIAKQELKEALQFLINSDKIKSFGIRPLKGILLTGPPGTGKTLLAKAAAGYSDAVFLASSGSEFIEMYAGVGAQRIRKIFQSAREKAKANNKNRAIIFIDEIEVIGGKRGSNTSHLEYDQTLNQFLVEMDGLKNNCPVNILVIGATNRADLLDPALLRPGRFDRQVKVDLPTLDGRLEILQLHVKNKKLSKEINLKEIAKETYGFSGAHLESMVNEAAILAMRENCKELRQRHFLEAIDKVLLGEKINNYANKEILNRVAVHEAGHALITEIIQPNSISHVTVSSRGEALGYVRQIPEEKKLYTEAELRNQIKICLAGSIAEKIFLGDKSTGANNDFKQALKYSKIIIDSGLSPLGIVSLEDVSGSLVNSTMQEIIQKEEKIVTEILAKNKNTLQEIANILKNKEKVSGEEISKIVGNNKDIKY